MSFSFILRANLDPPQELSKRFFIRLNVFTALIVNLGGTRFALGINETT